MAAALVALTGCSAANPPAPTSESAGSSGATVQGGGPVRSPGENRSLSGTAADGHELAACRDGECEVVVKAGDALDLDGRHGVDQLTVASLDGDGDGDGDGNGHGDGDGGVRIELRGSSGSLSVQGTGVSLSSVCDGGQCRDVGALTVRPDAPARINGLRLRLGARTADGAVLVLSPR
ncbi:hypothetical protein [Nonomuraea ceibae]|uniref:hypothetical protein n=1 Tax=Nonomuraea ceibae TaxID=1935170 RepID=UPI001C5F1346|nr:hypothetical protein [Nonomuraea ceibae]